MDTKHHLEGASNEVNRRISQIHYWSYYHNNESSHFLDDVSVVPTSQIAYSSIDQS